MRNRQAPTTGGIIKWHKTIPIWLVALGCLLGSGCHGEGGVQIPTESTEITVPTESVNPTEGTQATEPTQTTEPVQTELPVESTVPPTESTIPPTQGTEPTVEATEPPTETTEPTDPTEPSVPETEPPLQIQISPDQTQVLLIPKNAEAFTHRDLSAWLDYDIYNYKTVNQRLDKHVPATLSVKIDNIPQGVEVTSITFTVADNAALANGQEFSATGKKRYVEVPFLFADKTYYYQVVVAFSDGTTRQLQSSFHTMAAPRLLSIDGIVNVRDIGGLKTTDGYVIRQGLLYRGSELDGIKKPEYNLTELGLTQMRQILGIRTEMDLRYIVELPEVNNPLGEDVPHLVYGAPAYMEIFQQLGKDSIKQIFADLADESKYPVYVHCTYGLDRTGTICYLLEAMLGVGETDLQREYELSALYHTWVNLPGLESMLEELKTREGDTLQEKTVTFLTECGVTAEQIDRIREIFLEKQ